MLRPAALSFLTACVLALAGCGGDDPEPERASGGTPSASAPSEPAATESTEGALPEGVEPAAGMVMAIPDAQVTVPEGWRVTEVLSEHMRANTPIRSLTPASVTLRQIDSPFPRTVDQGAKGILEREDGRMSRDEDRTLDGVDFYQVSGEEMGGYSWVAHLGAYHEEQLYLMTFEFDLDIPRGEREAQMESVLATFSLT